jgi:hypothetical protein
MAEVLQNLGFSEIPRQPHSGVAPDGRQCQELDNILGSLDKDFDGIGKPRPVLAKNPGESTISTPPGSMWRTHLLGVRPQEIGPPLRTHVVNLHAENPWVAR